MDKHLAILAKQHIETRFVKINAEKSPFLTEKLKIIMLPTLALIKNTKVDDYVVRPNLSSSMSIVLACYSLLPLAFAVLNFFELGVSYRRALQVLMCIMCMLFALTDEV